MGIDPDKAREYLSQEAKEQHYAEEDAAELARYRKQPEEYLRDNPKAFTVGEIVADVFPAGSGERLEETFDVVNERGESYRGMDNPSVAGQNAKARAKEFSRYYKVVKERLEDRVENGDLESFKRTPEEVREDEDLDLDALQDLERPSDTDRFVFYIHEESLEEQ